MKTLPLKSLISVFLQPKRNFLHTSQLLTKEQQLKVGDWKINYLKSGDGNHNVFCMPGALGTIWTDFKAQIEGLNKDKFTLIVWEPPGYGNSRPPERSFSLDFYEEDAEIGQRFMKALGVEKYSMIGWSDGGVTAMILASKYPDSIRKLAVWGVNATILPTEMEAVKKMRDVKTWSPRMRKPMEEIYGEDYFAKLWANWVDIQIDIYSKKNGDICFEALKNIKCDTLILHGEKDPLVDISHISTLHTNIKKSRVHLYPDGKHNVHIKYAEDFNKRIEDFLLS